MSRDRMTRLARAFVAAQRSRLVRARDREPGARTRLAARMAAAIAECGRQCRKLDPAIPAEDLPVELARLAGEVAGVADDVDDALALAPVLATAGAALDRPAPAWIGPFGILLAPTSYVGAPIAAWCAGPSLQLIMELEDDRAETATLPRAATVATIAAALEMLVTRRPASARARRGAVSSW